ncbi:MAG: 2-deoxyribose-5-phosphate aldolase, partial [Anaerolineales bacterium]|nr:2-deoxyribose-5-phosphate aldolase [Anaerolineales bacterium]
SEKIMACLLVKEAGADYVKTSTGFSSGGAVLEDVELMFRLVAPDLKVKAAGGIGSCQKARAMIRAGASRIGASAGVAIVEEAAD